MFSTAVRAALIALTAAASVASAAPALSLKVTGPAAVDGVENLKVVTTLTNTGDETLKLLNDPRGALHVLPANTFDITTDDGASPDFTGVRVKYSLIEAAKSTDPSAFTVLAPGQSLSLTHDLSSAYNFTNTGHNNYTVEASNLFHFVNGDNEVVEIRADAESHVAALASGKLAVADSQSALTKRTTFHHCSASQKSALNAAASSAQKYASSAFSYLKHHSSTPRYRTWFGGYTNARHSTVLSHFSHISSHHYSSFTYDCSCKEANVYAFVYPNKFGSFHICPAFWSAPNTGTDSRAGTLIHEASHFLANGGTKDYVYGHSGAQSLARSNPGHAIYNADSHEYFAENHPAQS